MKTQIMPFADAITQVLNSEAQQKVYSPNGNIGIGFSDGKVTLHNS